MTAVRLIAKQHLQSVGRVMQGLGVFADSLATDMLSNNCADISLAPGVQPSDALKMVEQFKCEVAEKMAHEMTLKMEELESRIFGPKYDVEMAAQEPMDFEDIAVFILSTMKDAPAVVFPTDENNRIF
jgi:hypothetical protein